MPFSIRCSGCESALNVAENLIGKTIKCNKCGEMIAVRAPASAKAASAAPARSSRAVVVEDDDDSILPAKAPRRRMDADDDFDNAPRKKGTKAAAGGGKSNAPLLIGGLVALMLVAGGAGAYFAFFNDKKDDTTQNTGTNTPPPNKSPVDAGGPSGEGEKVEPEDKKPEIKPSGTSENATIKDSQQTQVQPPATPPASSPPVNSVDHNQKLMNGQIDEITLRTVKHATVFIEVKIPGGTAWGSGWFGIEPNIIFTNAHVLHMLAPNSPPPGKITIYVDSGERGQTPGVKQRVIEHSRIKILGVDRDNDLAILQIIGESNLPQPLKVRPSSELKQLQRVATIGFPNAYGTSEIAGGGKNQPSVSVRPTGIVALRYDRFGQLKLVQIEGAVNQGNSGGPIVDSEGYVIAVSVVGILDEDSGGLTSLVFGVATEHVTGLLSGRIDEVEYEQPYVDNNKVKVPVRMTVIDPLGRFKTAGVSKWIGDNAIQFRPPGTTRTGELPSDKGFEKIALKYDAEKKVATGEITYDPLPPGLAYWVQPYFSNTKASIFWNPGTLLPTNGPPVDRVASTLRTNLRPGTTRPITLIREATQSEFFEGEGLDKNERSRTRLLMKGTERIIDPDRNDRLNAARLRLTYEDIDIKRVAPDGRELANFPRDLLLELKSGINQIEAFGYLNRQGELYKFNTNSLAAVNPLVRAVVPLISDEVLSALQICSIPMPNKEVKPLESWGGGTTVPFKRTTTTYSAEPSGPGQAPRPGGQVVPQVRTREYRMTAVDTFTYLGSRTRGGKKEAVIKIEGKATPAAGQPKDSVYGLIKGYAFVDLNTGTVVESEIDLEFEVDTSEKGFKKKFSTLSKYRISRGGQTN